MHAAASKQSIYTFINIQIWCSIRNKKMISEGGASVGVSVVPLLLQERFRQLQRMKELREERELVRVLYSSSSTTPPPPPPPPPPTTHNNNNYEVLVVSESYLSGMFHNPPKPHCHLSLSLWPSHQDCRADGRPRAPTSPSNLPNSWFTHQNSASDIDTSLHLWYTCNKYLVT